MPSIKMDNGTTAEELEAALAADNCAVKPCVYLPSVNNALSIILDIIRVDALSLSNFLKYSGGE